jgi:hypothetical protein
MSFLTLLSLLTLRSEAGSGRELRRATDGLSPSDGGLELRSTLDLQGEALLGLSVQPGEGPVESRLYEGPCYGLFSTRSVDGAGANYEEELRMSARGSASLSWMGRVEGAGRGRQELDLLVSYVHRSTAALDRGASEELMACLAENPEHYDQIVTGVVRGTGTIYLASSSSTSSRSSGAGLGGSGSLRTHGGRLYDRLVDFPAEVDFALLLGAAPRPGAAQAPLQLGPASGDCAEVSWDEQSPRERLLVGVSKAFDPLERQAAEDDALREAELRALRLLSGTDLRYESGSRSSFSGRASLQGSHTEAAERKAGAEGRVRGLRVLATCTEAQGEAWSALNPPSIVVKVLADTADAEVVD